LLRGPNGEYTIHDPVKQADFYHGSQFGGLKQLEPRPSRALRGNSAVFATPSRDLALSYLAPWKDADFEQGHINGEPYMTEQYPGAFEKIYKGRSGSVYSVPEAGFSPRARLMREERVNRKPVQPLSEEVIPDAWDALQKTRFKLNRYGV
jgi:hypothetical protein